MVLFEFRMTNTTLPIRVATSADAARITAVINAAFRIAEGFFIESRRITEAEVEETLAKGAFLLAEDGEKLNGCVYVEMRGTRSYLGLLSVDPECQQSGIGSLSSERAKRVREWRQHWKKCLARNSLTSRHVSKS